jgi:hypothetical protein
LRSGKGRPKLKNLRNVNEIAELAKERWLKKRASNRTEYLVWQKKDLGTVIKTGTTAMPTVAAPSTAAE